jgi:hypothetical protein
MAETLTRIQRKSLNAPDEVRSHPKLSVEVVHVGRHTLMRATFAPGWRWSRDLKPAVGTDSCEVAHLGYLVSGRLATRMNDGSEEIFEPGDFVEIPPGHDGWVVGDEPVVFLDFVGGETYARPPR